MKRAALVVALVLVVLVAGAVAAEARVTVETTVEAFKIERRTEIDLEGLRCVEIFLTQVQVLGLYEVLKETGEPITTWAAVDAVKGLGEKTLARLSVFFDLAEEAKEKEVQAPVEHVEAGGGE